MGYYGNPVPSEAPAVQPLEVAPPGKRSAMVRPIMWLGSGALVLFLVLYGLDVLHSRPQFSDLSSLIGDGAQVQNAVLSMSQLVAAFLGVVITVVSIVVQLAATRYTPRIADLFFRERTNIGVLGFFVVACLHSIWLSMSIGGKFIPLFSVFSTTVMVTASLLITVPYFAYVFAFLDPERVVARIQEHAVASAPQEKMEPALLAALRLQTMQGTEQLADIALNAVSQKDKAIANGAVDALCDLAVGYQQRKHGIHADWFHLDDALRRNPDFIALTANSIAEIDRSGTWLEWKVLRQYQLVYNEALQGAPDINHLVAINTRYIGEAALASKDDAAFRLAVKFFNTYMRATLNTKGIRTAYNVLNQYRSMTERCLDVGRHEFASEIAFYLKYYGDVAHKANLAFITETVAYDLSQLCERAHRLKSPAHEFVLRHLLELDRQPENAAEETILRGVRKAQLRLATYYLEQEDEPMARRVLDDLKQEKSERLASLRDELMAVTSEDFWEVNDRGVNFDYLPPERKHELKTFFKWIGL